MGSTGLDGWVKADDGVSESTKVRPGKEGRTRTCVDELFRVSDDKEVVGAGQYDREKAVERSDTDLRSWSMRILTLMG